MNNIKLISARQKENVTNYIKIKNTFNELFKELETLINNDENLKNILKLNIIEENKKTLSFFNIPIKFELQNIIDKGIVNIFVFNFESDEYKLISNYLKYDWAKNILESSLDTFFDNNISVGILEDLFTNKDEIFKIAYGKSEEIKLGFII